MITAIDWTQVPALILSQVLSHLDQNRFNLPLYGSSYYHISRYLCLQLRRLRCLRRCRRPQPCIIAAGTWAGGSGAARRVGPSDPHSTVGLVPADTHRVPADTHGAAAGERCDS